jgi:predicted DNA-binding protein
MKREALTKGLNLRIAPSEMAMLDDLAAHTGLTKGAVVRQLIRREHKATVGEAPRAKRRK